ncbi:hypothetical protein LWM68_39605 [Niabella sp. W65]|nr:hypothetical protein [Niabella sp. W65]MCH7368306.1 hypothetical protein [Niabella sp. W65]
MNILANNIIFAPTLMSRQDEITTVNGLWTQTLNGLQPIVCKEQHIPGAVNYSIRRFMRDEENSTEDIGIVNYDYKGKSNEQNGVS